MSINTHTVIQHTTTKANLLALALTAYEEMSGPSWSWGGSQIGSSGRASCNTQRLILDHTTHLERVWVTGCGSDSDLHKSTLNEPHRRHSQTHRYWRAVKLKMEIGRVPDSEFSLKNLKHMISNQPPPSSQAPMHALTVVVSLSSWR